MKNVGRWFLVSLILASLIILTVTARSKIRSARINQEIKRLDKDARELEELLNETIDQLNRQIEENKKTSDSEK